MFVFGKRARKNIFGDKRFSEGEAEVLATVCPNAVVLGSAGCLVGSAPTTFVYTQALVTVRPLGGRRARSECKNVSVEKLLEAKAKRSTLIP
jgi:hypothetical protein